MRQLFDENLRVMVFNQPVDMRKSYDSLFKLVRANGVLKGGIFIFVAKNRKRAKALLWNKNGLMIMMQRMEEGKFADILRRDCISRDELLDFFEGEQVIKKIDLPSQDKLPRTRRISNATAGPGRNLQL